MEAARDAEADAVPATGKMTYCCKSDSIVLLFETALETILSTRKAMVCVSREGLLPYVCAGADGTERSLMISLVPDPKCALAVWEMRMFERRLRLDPGPRPAIVVDLTYEDGRTETFVVRPYRQK